MAAFNLTAEINLRGPSNLSKIAGEIRRELSSIKTDLNLNISSKHVKNIDAVTNSIRQLNDAIIQTQSNAANLGNTLGTLGQSTQAVGTGATTATKSMVELTSVTASISKQITSASSEMAEFGRQSAIAVRRFAAFSIPTGLIYGLARAVTSAFKEFVDFDRQIVKLQQTTGGFKQDVQDISSEIRRLSTSLGVSSKDLIEASVTLAQAGLSANETKDALEALAKSALAPSFDSITETTEGAIAAFRQFGIQTRELESVLGSINAVAAAFAVESSDIISAIQRTGGVFATASKGVSEGSDALNEFIAVFTSIRATTRESAETIATGLRTIFTRIQRGSTIEALKDFGVVLTDSENKFVGAFEAVRRLSDGLSRIDPRSGEFAAIAEELGGFRQIGKVIPLLQEFGTAQEALAIAQEGQGSLAKSAIQAQSALAVQFSKTREEFLAFVDSLGRSKTLQNVIGLGLSLTSTLIKVTSAFQPLLPYLAILGGIKAGSAVTQFAGGFFGGLKKRQDTEEPGRDSIIESFLGASRNREKTDTTINARLEGLLAENTTALTNVTSAIKSLENAINRSGPSGPTTLNNGGKVMAFARGGVVPGSGNRDTVPAMLMPGEFVIRKKAVETLGASNLQRMNKYAFGGKVKDLAQYYKSIPTKKGYEDIENQPIRDNSIFQEILPTELSTQEIETWRGDSAPRWKKFENLLSNKFPGIGKPAPARFALLDFPDSRSEAKFMAYGSTYDDPDSLKGNNDETIAAKNFLYENSLVSGQQNIKPSELVTRAIADKPVTTYWGDPAKFQKAGLYNRGGKIQKFMAGGVAEQYYGQAEVEAAKAAQEEYKRSIEEAFSFENLYFDVLEGKSIAEGVIPEVYGTGIGSLKKGEPGVIGTRKVRLSGAVRDDSAVNVSALDAMVENLRKSALQAREAQQKAYTDAQASVAAFKTSGLLENIDSGILRFIQDTIPQLQAGTVDPEMWSEEGATGVNLADIQKKLTKPNLAAFAGLMEGKQVQVQGQRTKLSEVFNSILETYGSNVSPIEQSNITSVVADKFIKSQQKANMGGLIQKFMAGGAVDELTGLTGIESTLLSQFDLKQVQKTSDDDVEKIIALIDAMGGNEATRNLANIQSVNIGGTNVQTGKILNANKLRSPQFRSYIPHARKIVDAAALNYNKKLVDKANFMTSMKNATNFQLATLLPFDSDRTIRDIIGGQPTIIHAKAVSSEYLDIIERLQKNLGSASDIAAEEFQMRKIFGTAGAPKGPLVFDFDETLIENLSDVMQTSSGAIDIAAFSDMSRVEKGLEDIKLTRLGEVLKEKLETQQISLNDLRIVTARPQSNAPYMAKALARLGLNIPESKITGVSGAENKINNVSELETLIDDRVATVEQFRSAGRKAISYAPIVSDFANVKAVFAGQASMEGAAAEKLLAKLGAPLRADAEPGRPIDYPDGLGVSAQYWNLDPSQPTEVKRELNSSAIQRTKEEIGRYYKLAKGGMLTRAMAASQSGEGKEIQRYKQILASILPPEFLTETGFLRQPSGAAEPISIIPDPSPSQSIVDTVMELFGKKTKEAAAEKPYYAGGLPYKAFRSRLEQNKGLLKAEEYKALKTFVDQNLAFQGNEDTISLVNARHSGVLAHETFHDIQGYLYDNYPEIIGKLQEAIVSQKSNIEAWYKDPSSAKWTAPPNYQLKHLFPESVKDSPYRADFITEGLPKVKKLSGSTAMSKSFQEQVFEPTMMDLGRLETIPVLLGASSEGNQTATQILSSIFSSAGLNPNFYKTLPKFADGGKTTEAKQDKQYGKIGLRNDGSEITATYFKNSTRQGMVNAKKFSDNLYTVGLSKATGGYGPRLYDVVMEAATANGAMLTSDRSMVSGSAKAVWDYYFNNRADVKKTPLDPSQWTKNQSMIDPKLYGPQDTWPPFNDPAWVLQSGYSKSPDLINNPDTVDMNDTKYQDFIDSQKTSFLTSAVLAGNLRNQGGSISKFAKGGSPSDTVPALLTPGEFVINKKAAQKIGYGKLHKLNKADKLQGYNRGGTVGGVQTFANGGKTYQAQDFFSLIDYSDVTGVNATISANGQKYAQALADAANALGDIQPIQNLAKKLQDTLKQQLQDIGMQPSQFGLSQSWAMWDIGKQLYLRENPSESSTKYRLGDPLNEPGLQQEMVDRMAGWEIGKATGNMASSSWRLTEVGMQARTGAAPPQSTPSTAPTININQLEQTRLKFIDMAAAMDISLDQLTNSIKRFISRTAVARRTEIENKQRSLSGALGIARETKSPESMELVGRTLDEIYKLFGRTLDPDTLNRVIEETFTQIQLDKPINDIKASISELRSAIDSPIDDLLALDIAIKEVESQIGSLLPAMTPDTLDVRAQRSVNQGRFRVGDPRTLQAASETSLGRFGEYLGGNRFPGIGLLEKTSPKLAENFGKATEAAGGFVAVIGGFSAIIGNSLPDMYTNIDKFIGTTLASSAEAAGFAKALNQAGNDAIGFAKIAQQAGMTPTGVGATALVGLTLGSIQGYIQGSIEKEMKNINKSVASSEANISELYKQLETPGIQRDQYNEIRTAIFEEYAAINKEVGDINKNTAEETRTALFNLAQAAKDAALAFVTIQAIIAGVGLARAVTRRSKGGIIGYYANGGDIFKPKGTDTVPAMLTPGEFVVNARSTRKNRGLLEAINSGSSLSLANGGVAYLQNGSSDMSRSDLSIMESTINRALGLLQVIGGGIEAAAGAGLFSASAAATVGTGGVAAPASIPGMVGGAAITAHGADQLVAGLRQLISGEQRRTLTSQGLDTITGNEIASDVVDSVASAVFTGGASALTKSVAKTATEAATEAAVKSATRSNLGTGVQMVGANVPNAAMAATPIARSGIMPNILKIFSPLSTVTAKLSGKLGLLTAVAGAAASGLLSFFKASELNSKQIENLLKSPLPDQARAAAQFELANLPLKQLQTRVNQGAEFKDRTDRERFFFQEGGVLEAAQRIKITEAGLLNRDRLTAAQVPEQSLANFTASLDKDSRDRAQNILEQTKLELLQQEVIRKQKESDAAAGRDQLDTAREIKAFTDTIQSLNIEEIFTDIRAFRAGADDRVTNLADTDLKKLGDALARLGTAGQGALNKALGDRLATVTKVQTDEINTAFKVFTDSLNKASDTFNETSRELQASIGTRLGGKATIGKASNENIIVLKNILASSNEEISSALDRIGGGLGFSPELTKFFKDRILIEKTLTQTLPTIIGQAIQRNATAGGRIEGDQPDLGFIKNEIQAALEPIVGEDIADSISTKLSALIQQPNREGGPLGGAKDLLQNENALKNIIEQVVNVRPELIQAEEARIKVINETNARLQEFADSLVNVTQLEIQAQKVRTDSAISINKTLNRPVSLAEQFKPFENEILSLTNIPNIAARPEAGLLGIGAQGVLDPTEIGRRLDFADKLSKKIQQEIDDIAQKPFEAGITEEQKKAEIQNRNRDIDQQRKNLGVVTSETQKLKLALDKVANSGERASLALNRLSELRQAQQGGRNLLTDVLKNVNNPEWQFDFIQSIGAYQRALAGNLRPFELPQAIAGLERAVSLVTPDQGEKLTKEFYNRILTTLGQENPAIINVLEFLKTNLGLRPGQDNPEIERVKKIAEAAAEEQARAIEENKRRLQEGGDILFKSVSDASARWLNAVVTSAEILEKALKPIEFEIKQPAKQPEPPGAAAQNQARGGLIYANKGQYINFEPKGTDTVPAMLTPGEFVVNKKATQKNLGLLKSINSGVTYAADGALISGTNSTLSLGQTRIPTFEEWIRLNPSEQQLIISRLGRNPYPNYTSNLNTTISGARTSSVSTGQSMIDLETQGLATRLSEEQNRTKLSEQQKRYKRNQKRFNDFFDAQLWGDYLEEQFTTNPEALKRREAKLQRAMKNLDWEKGKFVPKIGKEIGQLISDVTGSDIPGLAAETAINLSDPAMIASIAGTGGLGLGAAAAVETGAFGTSAAIAYSQGDNEAATEAAMTAAFIMGTRLGITGIEKIMSNVATSKAITEQALRREAVEGRIQIIADEIAKLEGAGVSTSSATKQGVRLARLDNRLTELNRIAFNEEDAITAAKNYTKLNKSRPNAIGVSGTPDISWTEIPGVTPRPSPGGGFGMVGESPELGDPMRPGKGALGPTGVYMMPTIDTNKVESAAINAMRYTTKRGQPISKAGLVTSFALERIKPEQMIDVFADNASPKFQAFTADFVDEITRNIGVAPQAGATLRETLDNAIMAARESPGSTVTDDSITALVNRLYKKHDIKLITGANEFLEGAGAPGIGAAYVGSTPLTVSGDSLYKLSLPSIQKSIDAHAKEAAMRLVPFALEQSMPEYHSNGGIIYANKGQYINFQPKGTDTVPAMLTPGEFVVNKKATQNNLGLLKQINSGSKAYSSGGVVYARDGGEIFDDLSVNRYHNDLAGLDDFRKFVKELQSMTIATIPSEDNDILNSIFNNQDIDTTLDDLVFGKKPLKERINSKLAYLNELISNKDKLLNKQPIQPQQEDWFWSILGGFSKGGLVSYFADGDMVPNKDSVKPKDLLEKYYEKVGGFDFALDQALKYGAGPAWGIPITKEGFDRPTPVEYQDLGQNRSGFFQNNMFSGPGKIVMNKDRMNDIPSLEHEATHAALLGGLTSLNDRSKLAQQIKSISQPQKQPSNWSYLTSPAEIDARLAEVKRLYAKEQEILVTDKGIAQQAWDYYSKRWKTRSGPKDMAPEDMGTLGADWIWYTQDAKLLDQMMSRMPSLLKDGGPVYARSGGLIIDDLQSDLPNKIDPPLNFTKLARELLAKIRNSQTLDDDILFGDIINDAFPGSGMYNADLIISNIENGGAFDSIAEKNKFILSILKRRFDLERILSEEDRKLNQNIAQPAAAQNNQPQANQPQNQQPNQPNAPINQAPILPQPNYYDELTYKEYLSKIKESYLSSLYNNGNIGTLPAPNKDQFITDALYTRRNVLREKPNGQYELAPIPTRRLTRFDARNTSGMIEKVDGEGPRPEDLNDIGQNLYNATESAYLELQNYNKLKTQTPINQPLLDRSLSKMELDLWGATENLKALTAADFISKMGEKVFIESLNKKINLSDMLGKLNMIDKTYVSDILDPGKTTVPDLDRSILERFRDKYAPIINSQPRNFVEKPEIARGDSIQQAFPMREIVFDVGPEKVVRRTSAETQFKNSVLHYRNQLGDYNDKVNKHKRKQAYANRFNTPRMMATGGMVYANNGELINFAPRGSDTIPAMLTPGEFVVNRQSTQNNLPLLQRINNGQNPSYLANGGLSSATTTSGGAGVGVGVLDYDKLNNIFGNFSGAVDGLKSVIDSFITTGSKISAAFGQIGAIESGANKLSVAAISINTASSNFSSTINNLNSSLSSLQNAISNIPSNISLNVNGSIPVNISIEVNGGDGLQADLMAFRSEIYNQIENSLRNSLPGLNISIERS